MNGRNEMKLTLPPAKYWPPANSKAFSKLPNQLHEDKSIKAKTGRGREAQARAIDQKSLTCVLHTYEVLVLGNTTAERPHLRAPVVTTPTRFY